MTEASVKSVSTDTGTGLIQNIMTAGMLLFLSATVLAHEYRFDDMRIAHPFAVETPPGAQVGAVYLDISNFTDSRLQLLSARAHIADRIEIHEMKNNHGVMEMRQRDVLTVEPEQTLLMRPGSGSHLMLINLKARLKDGDSFPLWLTFAGHDEFRVDVSVQTRENGVKAADAHHNH